MRQASRQASTLPLRAQNFFCVISIEPFQAWSEISTWGRSFRHHRCVRQEFSVWAYPGGINDLEATQRSLLPNARRVGMLYRT